MWSSRNMVNMETSTALYKKHVSPFSHPPGLEEPSLGKLMETGAGVWVPHGPLQFQVSEQRCRQAGVGFWKTQPYSCMSQEARGHP